MRALRQLVRFGPVAALLCAPLGHAADLAHNAVVYLHSDASWNGNTMAPRTVTWTHGVEGIFSAEHRYGNPLGGVSIRYDDGDFWRFDFAAPEYDKLTNTANGQLLTEGWYGQAGRLPSNSPTRPGFDFWGTGFASGGDHGWFNVLDIEYDSVSGDLERFAVDFRFAREGTASPYLYGSLRFNSDIAINPVPEPGAYTMLLAGLGVLALGARRRKPSCRLDAHTG